MDKAKALTEQDLKDIEARAEEDGACISCDVCEGTGCDNKDDYAYARVGGYRADIRSLLAEVQRQKDIAAAERALRKAENRFLLACVGRRHDDRVIAAEDVGKADAALRALGVDP